MIFTVYELIEWSDSDHTRPLTAELYEHRPDALREKASMLGQLREKYGYSDETNKLVTVTARSVL